MTRREWLAGTCATFAAACGVGRANAFESSRADAVQKTPEEWRRILDANEFNVLREAGTERAFTGDLWDHHEDGVYVCAGCGLPLFDSRAKFDSGTGWPSYHSPAGDGVVAEHSDTTYGMIRTEVLCNRCGGHLGHVFNDGPRPTGLRYCINSASLDFVPRAEAPAVDGAPVRLGGPSGPVAGSTP
jgi:peptide-methionine (R)-S-oxide reductase